MREGERREGGKEGGRGRDGENIEGYSKNEWMDCKRGKKNPYW